MTGEGPAHDTDDTGLRDAAMLDVDGIEFALDERLGFALFKTEFRSLVNCATQLDDALDRLRARFLDHAGAIAAAVRAFPAANVEHVIGADAALAALIDRTGTAYTTNAPAYITYVEQTHVVGANRSEDINRTVAVRVADDYAVMQDLPHGEERTGSAFPVIPFFDPFSSFRFSYFANLHKLDINFSPGAPFFLQSIAPDSSVDAVVPYFSEWAPHYAADSTAQALHLLIDPTPRTGDGVFYTSEVSVDAASQLPAHVTMQITGGDMVIGLDYSIVDGYWVITRGTWSSTQHVMGLTFKVSAETTFSDFTFPKTPPDPRLAGTPMPSPSASPSPSPSPSSGARDR